MCSYFAELLIKTTSDEVFQC